MKKTLLASVLLTAVSASAFMAPIKPQVKLIRDTKAQLNVCPVSLFGCADSITIKGKKYKITYDKASNIDSSNTELINKMVSSCRSEKLHKSSTFTAEGYVTTVKGIFPNPKAEFVAFSITALEDVNLTCQKK